MISIAMNLLKLDQKLVGTLTKEEAIDYVGGVDFFQELERDHALTPCRKLRTRVRYRIAELDRALLEAETMIRGGGQA